MGYLESPRQLRWPFVSPLGSVVAKRVMANHSATFDKGRYAVSPPLKSKYPNILLH